jgi:hypothetical protein
VRGATLRFLSKSRGLTRVLGRRETRIAGLGGLQVLLLFIFAARPSLGVEADRDETRTRATHVPSTTSRARAEFQGVPLTPTNPRRRAPFAAVRADGRTGAARRERDRAAFAAPWTPTRPGRTPSSKPGVQGWRRRIHRGRRGSILARGVTRLGARAAFLLSIDGVASLRGHVLQDSAGNAVSGCFGTWPISLFTIVGSAVSQCDPPVSRVDDSTRARTWESCPRPGRPARSRQARPRPGRAPRTSSP